MAASADVLKMIKDKDVKFVDLRFTDTRGKEQHVQVPAKQFTQDTSRCSPWSAPSAPASHGSSSRSSTSPR